MWSAQTITLIESAFAEDLPCGDISAALLPAGAAPIEARVVARHSGILAGRRLIPALLDVFAARLKASLELTYPPGAADDGQRIEAGDCVAQVRGPQAAVLSLERTLLNFLGRVSGVATHTRRYVDAAHAAAPRIDVLDTRKTLPGWRELDKYAVRCGGGVSHRASLSDAVLIKDNHIAGITTEALSNALRQMLNQALPEARRRLGLTDALKFVEVEVDSLDQLQAALTVEGIDIILLDNFPPATLRAAVRMRDEAGAAARVALEASGGVTMETIAAIAATGVERVSVGALTHSATHFDFGLDV